MVLCEMEGQNFTRTKQEKLYPPPNANGLKSSILHHQSLKGAFSSSRYDDCSRVSLATKGNSSTARGSYFSALCSKDATRDNMTETPVPFEAPKPSSSQGQHSKRRHRKEQAKPCSLLNRLNLKQHIDYLNRRQTAIPHKKSRFKPKTRMLNVINELSHSGRQECHFEDSGSHLFDAMNHDHQDGTETQLIDVHLDIEGNSREENVPFVCLMSRETGKPIIGHPLDTEVLADSSETSLNQKENVASKSLGNEESALRNLVWQTSKRTPVCYISDSFSPSMPKVKKAENGCEVGGDLIFKAGNGFPRNQQPLLRELKRPRKFKQSDTALLGRTYISVQHIFSKLLVAIGEVQS